MYSGQTVAVVIPALDEEATIAEVVEGLDRQLVDRVIVADNGSADETVARARAAGAEVVLEPRRGYGRACSRALARAEDVDLVVFIDGDGADDPAELSLLLERLVADDLDLVVGSRMLGRSERGALTLVQRLGNALSCTLVRWLWGFRYTDLGPYRAIRRVALQRLEMTEPAHGWTIEMQVKALQRGLRVAELPVSSRVRRGGRSKVSGTLLGSYRAGRRILGYLLEAKLKELRRSVS
jgi:glycosyltransferase involved in cell wall biosynthesis